MAGWNDLPVELKQQVILDVGDRPELSRSVIDIDPPNLEFIKTLSDVNWELYELAAAQLWETVWLGDRTGEALAFWIDKIAPRRARSVRQFLVIFYGVEGIKAGSNVQLTAQAMATSHQVNSLKLSAPSASISQLFDSLPPLFGTHVTSLYLRGGEPQSNDYMEKYYISASVATRVVAAMPNLLDLTFGDLPRFDDSTPFIATLQQLAFLRVLTSNTMYGFDDPLLACPWRSSLSALKLESPMPGETLVALLAHHSSTLWSLRLSMFIGRRFPDKLPRLPCLHTLFLWSSFGDPDQAFEFSRSPIRDLTIRVMEGDDEAYEPLRAVRRALHLFKKTLVTLTVEVNGGLDDEGRRLGLEVERECEQMGVGVVFKLAEEPLWGGEEDTVGTASEPEDPGEE